MTSAIRKVESVDQIGLSSLTFCLREAPHVEVPRVWKPKSQPTRLLILGLLVMSCLCGSIYYGSVRMERPPAAGQPSSR